MGSCGYVVSKVDKQAYLSSFALATYIVVTCDSTSMISEAATSGKPIFVAHMKTKKNNYRFKRFFELSLPIKHLNFNAFPPSDIPFLNLPSPPSTALVPS